MPMTFIPTSSFSHCESRSIVTRPFDPMRAAAQLPPCVSLNWKSRKKEPRRVDSRWSDGVRRASSGFALLARVASAPRPRVTPAHFPRPNCPASPKARWTMMVDQHSSSSNLGFSIQELSFSEQGSGARNASMHGSRSNRSNSASSLSPRDSHDATEERASAERLSLDRVVGAR